MTPDAVLAHLRAMLTQTPPPGVSAAYVMGFFDRQHDALRALLTQQLAPRVEGVPTAWGGLRGAVELSREQLVVGQRVVTEEGEHGAIARLTGVVMEMFEPFNPKAGVSQMAYKIPHVLLDSGRASGGAGISASSTPLQRGRVSIGLDLLNANVYELREDDFRFLRELVTEALPEVPVRLVATGAGLSSDRKSLPSTGRAPCAAANPGASEPAIAPRPGSLRLVAYEITDPNFGGMRVATIQIPAGWHAQHEVRWDFGLSLIHI